MFNIIESYQLLLLSRITESNQLLLSQMLSSHIEFHSIASRELQFTLNHIISYFEVEDQFYNRASSTINNKILPERNVTNEATENRAIVGERNHGENEKKKKKKKKEKTRRDSSVIPTINFQPSDRSSSRRRTNARQFFVR